MASKGFKQRQYMRDLAYGAMGMLSPGAIGSQFQGLQQQASPFLNQMLASQSLQGQMQANSAMANLGRAGLGSTGLGAALGSGLQAGSAFQGNQLRARLFSDLFNQAQNTQLQKANIFTGTQMGGANTFAGFADTLSNLSGTLGFAGSLAGGVGGFMGGGGLKGFGQGVG